MNKYYRGFILVATPLLLLLTLQASLSMTAQVLYRLQLQQQRWQRYEHYRQRLLDAWQQWQVEHGITMGTEPVPQQRYDEYAVQSHSVDAQHRRIRLFLLTPAPAFMTNLAIVQRWRLSESGWQPCNGSWRVTADE